ncbi:MAG: hypothetical protein JKX85_14690 [Phycisphaeraceae bacterium]|nr:hypothetical protein [Phycisphaeraceae bacterium]
MNLKKTTNIVALAVLYVLPVLLIGGCNKYKIAYPNPINEEWSLLAPQQAMGVVGESQPLIPDVGQPIGFKALAKQSHYAIVGNAREVKHVYQGRARLDDVISFYRSQLVRYGWQMGNDEHEERGFVLNRNKGPERLRILMYAQGDRVTVVIMIGPIYNIPSGTATPKGPLPNQNLGSNS